MVTILAVSKNLPYHGELVDFRPVKQNDKETIQKGMLALFSKSRYFRFFSPILKLSDTQYRQDY